MGFNAFPGYRAALLRYKAWLGNEQARLGSPGQVLSETETAELAAITTALERINRRQTIVVPSEFWKAATAPGATAPTAPKEQRP